MGKAGWMNLASLCLGALAWVLPLAAVALKKKAAGCLCPTLVWASAMACAAALYFQICYQNRLVKMHDIAAILDTTDALTFVASVLIVVTAALDAAAMAARRCAMAEKNAPNA